MGSNIQIIQAQIKQRLDFQERVLWEVVINSSFGKNKLLYMLQMSYSYPS